MAKLSFRRRAGILLAAGIAACIVTSVGGQPQTEWRAWIGQRTGQYSGSVLVARGDAVEFSGAYGLADRAKNTPNTIETRFNLGSINKTFTALAVAQLIERQRLSLQDTIATHIRDYPNTSAAAKITVAHLISHRSGVATLMRPDFGAATVAEMVRAVGQEPQVFEPGERQAYSNGGYIVLGRIVEVVSGQRYTDYVAEHIYRPAGMTNSGFLDAPGPAVALGYFAVDAEGRPLMGMQGRPGGPGGAPAGFNASPVRLGNPAGGGYSTVSDMFRFARALKNGRLLNARMTDYVMNGSFKEQFGFALREQVVGSHRFIGNGGGASGVNAEFRFEPAGDYTVVVLANASPPSATQLLGDILGRIGG
jgi:D-alanyl-D-alanine carboxypeptidase